MAIPSIDERLAAWRKTGDESALWPQTSPAARDAAQQALVRLTAAVLSHPSAVPRLTVGSEEELAALGVVAFRSGMGPLARWWLTQGRISADSQVAELLDRQLAYSRQRAAVLEAGLLRVLDVLEAARVPVTLLKGAHTARAYFPAPGTRPAADLDLLVEPASFPAAVAALNAGGYREVLRTRRPARSEWVAPGAPQVVKSLEVEHPENPWGIDLHRTLERRYYRGVRVEIEPGFWRTTWLDVAGRRVRGLAQPLLLAFLALHASYGARSIRLLQLAELVQVIRCDVPNGRLVWEELGELLATAKAERFVYPALELAEWLVPGTVDARLRARLTRAATPRMRRVVDWVAAAGMQAPFRSLDGLLMWAKGPFEILNAVGELLLPGDDATRLRQIGPLYLRRWRLLRAQGLRRTVS